MDILFANGYNTRENNDIVDSTSKHKKILIGTECKYAVNYVRDLSFSKTICKLNENDFETLKND